MSAAQAGANYSVAWAAEFSGGNVADWFEAVAGATGTSTTPTVNVTTGASGALIAAIVSATSGSDPAAGSGYTLVTMADGHALVSGEYDLDVGAAGSKTVDFTSSNVVWNITAAAFNALPSSFTITPPAGTVTFIGYAPTVGGKRSAAPAVGTVSVTGYAPIVSTTMSPNKVPIDATVTFTGYAPTVVNANIGSAAIDLLVHTISASGTNYPVGTTPALDLLVHTLDASGVTGGISSAAITLLAHTLDAGGNHGAEIDLLIHELTGAGVAGGLGEGESNLLVHTISGSGIATNAGTASISLLTHTTDTAGTISILGVLEAELATHTLETAAYSGAVGTASITLHLHTTATVAFQPGTGSAEIELVTRYLEAAGFATLAETYRGWALNTRTNGLTEYSNFSFNSFAELDGVYLAAGPSGIHVLGTQDLDGAADINGRVRVGSIDFGSSFLKRVPRIYVSGEFDEQMYFRTITEQDGERTYVLHSNGITGDQQRRVPVGQGPKSVQWQFEAENVSGSDFRLSKILVYPKELGRRTQ